MQGQRVTREAFALCIVLDQKHGCGGKTSFFLPCVFFFFRRKFPDANARVVNLKEEEGPEPWPSQRGVKKHGSPRPANPGDVQHHVPERLIRKKTKKKNTKKKQKKKMSSHPGF